MQQLAIDFATNSPINKEKLKGQNRSLYLWLLEGNTIHMMHEARQRLGIGYLNSRASDLVNKHGINLHKRFIKVNGISVVEYSLKPFK